VGSIRLSIREILPAKICNSVKMYRRWLFRFAIVLLSCGAIPEAQSSASAETGGVSNGISLEAATLANTRDAAQKTEERASQAARPGSIVGTVLDQAGAASVGAVIRLTSKVKSFSREAVSGDNGQFSFSNVPPGYFTLSVNSAGFGNQAFSGELAPGETYLVPAIVLSVATVVTTVDVKEPLDPVELATEQVKEQEQQRVLRFIPNFYVTYRDDAAPLTTKLKFQLAWKSSTDPVTFFGTAFLAGLQQAGDQHSEFGQGAQGYGKRFGAAYTSVITSTFLSGAVFPSLLKQDPRYFYKGTGTTGSRILHAVGNPVVCKGDNGRWQMNYSNIAGIFGGAAVSSTYYPARNQAAVILSNSLIRLGESSLAGIFQEFIARKLTRPPKEQVLADSESSQAPSTQSKPALAPKKP
jgi:Carboxypeptidase regulatory-like domain